MAHTREDRKRINRDDIQNLTHGQRVEIIDGPPNLRVSIVGVIDGFPWTEEAAKTLMLSLYVSIRYTTGAGKNGQQKKTALKGRPREKNPSDIPISESAVVYLLD